MSTITERNTWHQWYADAEFELNRELDTTEVIEIVDHFSEFGAVTESHQGSSLLGVSIEIEATDAIDAFTKFQTFADKFAEHVSGASVVEVNVMTEEQKEKELAKPLLPEVAGLSEVAELANVSKQRANSLVKNKSFPEPITELASGKIWWKPAVAQWVDNWTRTPGRPRNNLQTA